MTNKDYTNEYDAQHFLLIVIVALAPCFMMGVYVFGLDMLDNMIGGCGAAVLLTFLMGKIQDIKVSKSGSADMKEAALRRKADREPLYFSAMITGTLIVFGLPSTMPIHQVFAGVAIAVVPVGFLIELLQRNDWSLMPDRSEYTRAAAQNVLMSGKCLFERAIVSASAAQVALWLLFRTEATTWPLNDFVETRVSPGDVATGMTPLGILAEGDDLPSLSRMFIGFISGPCGEVSVAAALIGGAYLIWKKIISPMVPVLLMATIFAVSFVYYMTAIPQDELGALMESDATGASAALYMAAYQLMAGGAVFGACFLAPAICLRPDNAAVSRKSKILTAVCAAGIGAITMALRFGGIMTEGIALPVLIVYAIYVIIRTGIKLPKQTTAAALIVMLSFSVIPEQVSAADSGYRFSITIGKYGSGTVVPVGSRLKLSCKGRKKRNGVSSGTTLVYRSSDKKIATVSSKGVVRGRKKGKVKITVYCKANRRVRKTITILVGERVKKISIIGYKYLRPGRKVKLKANVYPSTAANPKVKWSSSNTKVVKVSSSGRIETKKTGTAVIYAKAKDGSGVRGKYKITVFRLKHSDAHWVAHRGLALDATENTLAAFEKAGKAGFWGAECDIWETRRDEAGDFDLVLQHDDTYKRIYGKSDHVWDIEAQDVREVISPEVCFLKEYLSVCRSYDMVPVIEMKEKSDGSHCLTAEGVEKMLNDIEQVYGTENMPTLLDSSNADVVRFISYNINVLKLIKSTVYERCGVIPYTGVIIKDEPPEGVIDAADEENRLFAIDINKNSFTPAIYQQCLDNGLSTGIWAYNDSAADDEYLYQHILSGKYIIEMATSNSKVFD